MNLFNESQVICKKCGEKYTFIAGGKDLHTCKKNLITQLFQQIIEAIERKNRKKNKKGKIRFEPKTK